MVFPIPLANLTSFVIVLTIYVYKKAIVDFIPKVFILPVDKEKYLKSKKYTKILRRDVRLFSVNSIQSGCDGIPLMKVPR